MNRKFAYAALSIVPVRAEPLETTEMTTQLLFGELVEILEQKKSWFLIVSQIDNYTGWVDEKMLHLISEESFIATNNTKRIVLKNHMILVKSSNLDYLQRLLPGSFLWNLNETNKHFYIGDNEFKILSELIDISVDTDNDIIDIAKSYINSPYLWGGKSFFGIDCSGFTQVVYRQIHKYIPRDTRQQVNLGQNVSFINEVNPGDLAFFENEENEITHVGIIINKDFIIHASGEVRIDPIDHQGIFNKKLNKYTHKLRIIKRIL